mmetsp:Transcript_34860/g.72604  ORF Transcript_34860/g.72604 Transcript_34860/m.72604 type:complete len:99 (-) Transcript_34860:262-558(-)
MAAKFWAIFALYFWGAAGAGVVVMGVAATAGMGAASDICQPTAMRNTTSGREEKIRFRTGNGPGHGCGLLAWGGSWSTWCRNVMRRLDIVILVLVETA